MIWHLCVGYISRTNKFLVPLHHAPSSRDCSSDCQQSNTTMTTTINKVDDFLEAFPNKVIKHTGRPDYKTLNNIKTALKRNFATVPCTLRGGTHGYLGAVLTAAEYAAATPNNTPPFVDPLFPGAAAVIPPNSTRPQIAAIERQFNKALRQWTEYKNLTDAGKKFIQDGIDDMYLKGITDRNVGLTHITIRSILSFLFQNYGNITQYDIKENDKKLKEKWDANTPIKMLFDQIEDAQDFAAAAGQPYTNNQLLTTAYNLVYATGLFFDDCKACCRILGLTALNSLLQYVNWLVWEFCSVN